MTGPLLEAVVAHQTATRERWLQALVHDELGIVDEDPVVPWRQGLSIGASFVLGGLIPTVPLILNLPRQQVWAFVLTAITALALGALKARYSLKGPVRNGLEFLAVVTAGTIAGAGIGLALHAAQ